MKVFFYPGIMMASKMLNMNHTNYLAGGNVQNKEFVIDNTFEFRKTAFHS